MSFSFPWKTTNDFDATLPIIIHRFRGDLPLVKSAGSRVGPFNKRNRRSVRDSWHEPSRFYHPNRKQTSRGRFGARCFDISARRCFPSADVSWKAILTMRLRFVRLADQPFDLRPRPVDRALCTSASIGPCSTATCSWYMLDYPSGLLSTGDKAKEVILWLFLILHR